MQGSTADWLAELDMQIIETLPKFRLATEQLFRDIEEEESLERLMAAIRQQIGAACVPHSHTGACLRDNARVSCLQFVRLTLTKRYRDECRILHAGLREGESMCIKPLDDGGGVGVARLVNASDLATYAHCLISREAAIPPLALSWENTSIPMPQQRPLQLLIEPYIKADRQATLQQFQIPSRLACDVL